METNHIKYLQSLNKPKLIAMDVDGTLVPHGGTIGELTKKTLKRIYDSGIDIVLVTARPARWLERVVNELGFQPIAICGNGALTIDTSTQKVLELIEIDSEVALESVKLLKTAVPDTVFAAEAINVLKASPGYEDLPDGVIQAEGLVPLDRYSSIKEVESFEEMFDEKVYKIVAETFELDADEFLQIASDLFGEVVSVTRSVKGRSFIEFGPNGLSKAKTLERYAKSRGLTENDVIAFGDMLNDLDMLMWAKTGVAMGNSHDEVKKIADIITLDAENDGIGVVLDIIFEKK